MPVTETPIRMPVVPEPFRSALQTMRAERDPRLPAVLHLANLNDWTLQSLGDALGVSRERVRQLIQGAPTGLAAGLPDIPAVPRRQLPNPKPPTPRLRIKSDLAGRLQEMQRVAATVNGSTPADDPARDVSENYTALLASLADQGVAVRELARAVGVKHSAISSRLARHGYRPASPAADGVRYRGQPSRTSVRRQVCAKGHPLSGDNLYVVPTSGMRVCRSCASQRTKDHRARKQAARSPST